MARPPQGLIAYMDVIPMFDTALMRNEPEMRFQCASASAATATLHRLNRFRQLDRSRSPDQQSKYDQFILRKDDSYVVIARRPRLACIAAFDHNGNEIPLDEIRALATPSRTDIERAIDNPQDTPEIREHLRRIRESRPPTINDLTNDK